MFEMITQKKKCSKCGEVKSINQFNKDRSRADGMAYVCKVCSVEKGKRYYSKNSARVLGRQKENRNKDRDGFLYKLRKWQNDNREKVREYVKRWTERNIDKAKKQQKAWRDSHKEHIREKSKKWALANPDKRMLTAEKRRIAKKSNGGIVTAKEWSDLKSKYDNKCLCCKRSDVRLTMDHVVPISMGGKHVIDNIQPLCGSCNSSKHTKIVDYRP